MSDEVVRRPSWPETWLKIADDIGQRSACRRRKAGCVIVNDNRIVGTGYNGPAAGFRDISPYEDCSSWCPRGSTGDMIPHANLLSYGNCVAVHAEANALMYSDASARVGGVAFCTSCPCYTCAQLLSNAGLARVVCSVLEVDRGREPHKSLAYMVQSGVEIVVARALPEFKEDLIKLGIRPVEWVQPTRFMGIVLEDDCDADD